MNVRLLILIFMAVLPVCDISWAEPLRPFRIGFSQSTTTEPWRLMFNRELRAQAARFPEVDLHVANGMDEVAKQADDIQQFIAQRMDLILISPKEGDGLTAVVNQAFDAGIPIIVLDMDIANDRYTQFIGGDNREIGRVAGRYAVDLLGGKGQAKGNVVEIWGGIRSTSAQGRHQGFAQVIRQEAGIRLLTEPEDGDWKQDIAYEIMAEALEEHRHIDLVYAHNDAMAYGTYLAALDEGRQTEIRFLGIDGIPAEGVKWVYEGILTATFLYKTPGDEGIRQAIRILRGEKVEKRIVLPTTIIDKKNASQILQAHGLLR